MTITISNAEGGIDEIKAAAVRELIKTHGEELSLLTPSQVCGLLDITPKSLADMNIPRVDLLNNGRAIRYRATDVAAKLKERTIKAKPSL